MPDRDYSIFLSSQHVLSRSRSRSRSPEAALRDRSSQPESPSSGSIPQMGAPQTLASSASTAAAAGATVSATTSSASAQGQVEAQAAATSPAGAAAEPAVIAPPAVRNLTAHQMTAHYLGIIQWAQSQGTFSAEFHFVRNQPNAARAILQNAGMGPGDAQAYVDTLVAEIRARPGTEDGYVDAEIQDEILNQSGLDNHLLAVIRYMTRR